MSNLEEISFNQIKKMVFQLDFNKKMDLIRAISKEPRYRENFYEYTESLVKKYNIPQMSEEKLDNFLHDKE
jgi:hypothetical protein